MCVCRGKIQHKFICDSTSYPDNTSLDVSEITVTNQSAEFLCAVKYLLDFCLLGSPMVFSFVVKIDPVHILKHLEYLPDDSCLKFGSILRLAS